MISIPNMVPITLSRARRHAAHSHICVDKRAMRPYPSGMSEKPSKEHVVDARGLRCPLPVLKARKALMARAPGALIRLIATDGAAWIDVPHFCAEAGHELVESRQTPECAEFLIRRGVLRIGEDGG